MSDRKKIAVIGAGIAGLTVAWRLKQAGCKVTVFEQSNYAGGCIKSFFDSGYLLEMGPNTILNSSTALWKLAADLGLEKSRLAAQKEIGSRRFIYRKMRLIEVPAGPKILFSPVLSVAGRLRILKEPFIAKRSDNAPESLASFIKRRLGKEVLRNLVTPFVSGIYAGDPEKLCLKSVFPKLHQIERDYGGIFKGMRALRGDIKASGLSSFRGGLGELILSLSNGLGESVVKGAKVKEVKKTGEKFSVVLDEAGLAKKCDDIFDKVVVATQSFAAAKIVSSIDRDLSGALQKIEYAPVVVSHLGFKKEDIGHHLNGFGYLVPREEGVRQLGTLWSSSLFSGRAPKGRVLLTNFTGGALDPEAVDLNDDDILKQTLADLKKTLKISGNPEFVSITRYAHAIPQFNLGYDELIKKIRESVSKINGLHLAGSYAEAVSVAGTVEHAEKVAAQIADNLKGKL